MDDLQYGTRDKRGDWTPNEPLATGPLFAFPPKPLAILNWLPGYFLPWNALLFGAALVTWNWLTPSPETTKFLAPGWIIYILLRNMAAVFLFYGAFELRLYMRRKQSAQFKYNAKWPSENASDVFMFSSQNIDNMIRGFGTGVPIWTAYEVLFLWLFSNGWMPWLNFTSSMAWLVCLGLVVPLIHEFHFYCIHRLIHIPILYKWIHSVHHNSVNPSPWSSLSMHPIEHLLYWSGTLVHLVFPSHPLLALYHLQLAAFGAVIGHVGFDKIVAGDDKSMDTHAYAHYLHHKHFEVNFADGGIPLDKWFGTWHDGTKEGEALMTARYTKKVARVNKKDA
jgi:sterol desaturase/sphingolipid hydroxylase (fatty acid hydroxylase superfamily)